jgi:dihydrolipoamide dehydrogenase
LLRKKAIRKLVGNHEAKMERFDICVIGGGPAGYAAAMRGLDLGKKVLLVEKDRLGGAGLYNGALSSKALWAIAQNIAVVRAHAARHNLEVPVPPFSELQSEVEATVNSRQEQLKIHAERLEKKGLTLIFGTAHLASNTEIYIQSGDETLYATADNIVLATGSKPRKLDTLPIDEQIILTSDGISNLTEYPESMVILGAGVIGCEFATIFALLGKTKVFLIDKADRILPFEDEDVVNVVEQSMEAHGVTIHRNSSLVRMEVVDGIVEYELQYSAGYNEVIRVEKALVAIGRIPVTEGLGLENAGVALTDRGHILEDGKDTTTSVPNIYAVGDITADIALVNVGEMEGRFSAEIMYDQATSNLCYDNISTIMFLHPEVAGVGMNETQARAAGIPYRMACVDYCTIPRAIAVKATNGFFKVLVTDDDEMRLLGMRAIGLGASSAIQGVALLISMGKGVQELADCVHPHPSFVEGVQECARMLLGTSILKPDGLKDNLRCGRYSQGKWGAF